MKKEDFELNTNKTSNLIGDELQGYKNETNVSSRHLAKGVLLILIVSSLVFSVGCKKDESTDVAPEDDATDVQTEVIEEVVVYEPDVKQYMYSKTKSMVEKAPKSYNAYVEEFEGEKKYFVETFDNKGNLAWTIEWRDLDPEDQRIASKPAISKDKFFIEINGILEARNLKTGEFLWEIEEIGRTERLIVSNKVLYFFGVEGDFVRAINTENGETLFIVEEDAACSNTYWYKVGEEILVYCDVDSSKVKKELVVEPSEKKAPVQFIKDIFKNLNEKLEEAAASDQEITTDGSESDATAEPMDNPDVIVENNGKVTTTETKTEANKVKIVIKKNEDTVESTTEGETGSIINEAVIEYTGCRYDLDGKFLGFITEAPYLPSKHVWREATSSSVLENRDGNYEPKNIIDGSMETAWSEGVKGYGEDEWIEISSRVPYLINSITFYNGYHKSKEDYQQNGKVDEIEIILGDADSLRYSFLATESVKEGFSSTTINLLTPVEVDYMNFTIRSGSNSELYKHTFITEITTK